MAEKNSIPTPHQAATASVGPVSIDDVRSALGDTDPHATNAARIRATLKRGSMATIQRHLETLRTEARAATAVPADAATAPPVPADWQAVWQVAYGVAAAKVMGRLESLAAERDAAMARATAAEADVESMAGEYDRAVAAQATAEANIAAVFRDRDTLEQQLKDAREQFGAERAEAGRVLRDAQHAAELAARDAALQRQTLEAAIDRAGQREGELRAQLMEAQRRADDLVAKLAGVAAEKKA